MSLRHRLAHRIGLVSGIVEMDRDLGYVGLRCTECGEWVSEPDTTRAVWWWESPRLDWIRPGYWRYLFSPQGPYDRKYLGRFGTAWCRARGHAPVVGGTLWADPPEPDMHCSRCGEDLG